MEPTAEELKRFPHVRDIRIFEYPPLSSPNSIRLLHLHSLHSSDPSQPLTGELHEVDTAELEKSYTALSYCWGEGFSFVHGRVQQAPRVDFISNVNLFWLYLRPSPHQSQQKSSRVPWRKTRISRNLSDALRYLALRPADGHRFVWADAVCINQRDLAEQGSQVLRMRDVYEGATEVLAWIGEGGAPAPAKHVRTRSEGSTITPVVDPPKASAVQVGDDEDITEHASQELHLTNGVENSRKTKRDDLSEGEDLAESTPSLRSQSPRKRARRKRPAKPPPPPPPVTPLSTAQALRIAMKVVGQFAETRMLVDWLVRFVTRVAEEDSCKSFKKEMSAQRTNLTRGKYASWLVHRMASVMLHSNWFRRMWTFQEAVLAPRLSFVCNGAEPLGSEAFFRGLRNLMELDRGALTSLRNEIKSLSDLSRMINFARSHAGPANFLDLMRMTRAREATDPRDKLYALMGLADVHPRPGTLEAAIAPDYTKSLLEVNAAFALWHARKSQTLEFLLDLDPNNADEHMPTWLPSWHLQPDRLSWYTAGNVASVYGKNMWDLGKVGGIPFAATATPSSSGSNAGAATTPLQISHPVVGGEPQPGCIVLRGWRVDRIATVAQPPDERRYLRGLTAESWHRWIRLAECERNRDGEGDAEVEERPRFWEPLLEMARYISGAEDDEVEEEQGAEEGLWEPKTFQSIVVLYVLALLSYHRTMARTDAGRATAVYPQVHVGDEVVLLRGATMPTVLRRVEEAGDAGQEVVIDGKVKILKPYRVIEGAAMVTGLMWGEAYRDANLEEEDIFLC